MRFRMISAVLGAALCLFLPGATLAAEKLSGAAFATQAAASGLFEIESSKVALRKSDNAATKEFAQTMITDHGKAAVELRETASSANISPGPNTLDDKHKAMLGKLNDAPKAGFDALYGEMQLTAHQEAVDLFGSYAKEGDEPGLKAFATKTLPILQAHLEHAKQLPRK